MTRTWTVRDDTGHLLSHFEASSRLEVARKLVPVHYDAFRLLVSPSYREQFDRALNLKLRRQGWRIVQTRTRGGRSNQATRRHASSAACRRRARNHLDHVTATGRADPGLCLDPPFCLCPCHHLGPFPYPLASRSRLPSVRRTGSHRAFRLRGEGSNRGEFGLKPLLRHTELFRHVSRLLDRAATLDLLCSGLRRRLEFLE